MTEIEHLMVCLFEECAEVQQEIAKALRFGLTDKKPDQPLTNEQRIVAELVDIVAVVRLLHERGVLLDLWDGVLMQQPADDAVSAKMRKVAHWMQHARNLGTLVE